LNQAAEFPTACDNPSLTSGKFTSAQTESLDIQYIDYGIPIALDYGVQNEPEKTV
jgi:hypothetical protein